MAEKGVALPKFGEWDVNDPSAGHDFSVIFNKASKERKRGAKFHSPGHCDNTSECKPQVALAKSHYKKWLCCFINPSVEA